MYYHFHKYLVENDTLYAKQFGFQKSHSTDHVVIQLVDQITESFENNKYALGAFIDLSKAFNTVDLSIFVQKLELYGITDINHGWFSGYL